ncbi:MAG: 50S ribosomal protein L25 [Deltaproteobacteria bacterium]|nr:50S ribosomal protein L25 [Deltaproteobacteria bacterium]
MEKSIEMMERTGEGKGEARKLRADRRIPAVCYGKHLKAPVAVSVDRIEIAAIVRSSDANDLFTVKAEGSPINGELVLIKTKQTDPLTDEMIHIDFQTISKGEPIKAIVTIELVGKSKGVAEGGILQQPNRTLEIKCLPSKMPSSIKVDITNVGLNESLHVSDITLPEGVEVVGTANKTLAVVIPPADEVAQPTEAVAADAVEVAGKKKPEGDA